MKKQTEYQKTVNIAKKLRKLSFLGEYCNLIGKVCNSIKESMKRLGRYCVALCFNSRLCFTNEEAAKYIATQFIDLYKDFLI